MIGISTGIAFIPEVRGIARTLDLDGMLVETDSPYMSPIKGKRNRPSNVRLVVGEVARMMGLSFKEVEWTTERNAIRFFGLRLDSVLGDGHDPIIGDEDKERTAGDRGEVRC